MRSEVYSSHESIDELDEKRRIPNNLGEFHGLNDGDLLGTKRHGLGFDITKAVKSKD